MAQKIQVEIEYNEELPLERRYMASINDENYKMLVSADSIANCFKELSTSIYVSDEYKKTKMAQKLYTEEQVRRIAKLYRQELYLLEAAINTETPIELPSDEEINERSYYDKDNDKLIVNAAEIARFRNGAKWLRDKILNQNNKQ